MRTLVVTVANEPFMPLLRGLVESLRQWQPAPFTDLACAQLCTVDGAASGGPAARAAQLAVPPGPAGL